MRFICEKIQQKISYDIFLYLQCKNCALKNLNNLYIHMYQHRKHLPVPVLSYHQGATP